MAPPLVRDLAQTEIGRRAFAVIRVVMMVYVARQLVNYLTRLVAARRQSGARE